MNQPFTPNDMQANQPGSGYMNNPGNMGYSNNPTDPRYQDDEIDLAELFAALMKRKWLIIGLSLGLGFIVAVYSLTIQNQYKAQVTLVPANSSGAGGLGALAGQFGGLASLAGISLPSGSDGGVQEALSVIKSRQFISEFIRKHNLKPVLFYEAWDSENQQWITESPGLVERLSAAFGQNSQALVYEGMESLVPGEPSMWEAYELFTKKVMQVAEDKKSGNVTLSIEWINPVQARDWANTLVREINEQLRRESIEKSATTISYLEKQLEEIQLVELKQITFKLIEENVKNMTLANTQQDYVFKVIDPAVVPEEKSKPKRSLMVAVALVLGFMLGVFIALILNWRENAKKAQSSDIENV